MSIEAILSTITDDVKLCNICGLLTPTDACLLARSRDWNAYDDEAAYYVCLLTEERTQNRLSKSYVFICCLCYLNSMPSNIIKGDFLENRMKETDKLRHLLGLISDEEYSKQNTI